MRAARETHCHAALGALLTMSECSGTSMTLADVQTEPLSRASIDGSARVLLHPGRTRLPAPMEGHLGLRLDPDH